MPDLSPRPAPRLVDHMNDAKGYDVAFFADRDAILIRHLGQFIRLGPAERDPFIRLFLQAERQAGAYKAPAS